MQIKDYKEIAKIIKESNVLDINLPTIRLISNRLADYFEKDDNTIFQLIDRRFDKKQFLKDCGVV